MIGELDSEWLEMMSDTITVTPFLQRNARAEPIYDTANAFQVRARVEQTNREFRTNTGQVNVATTVIYTWNTPRVIGSNDKFTLPDGSTAPTLGVDRVTDDRGVHHYEIYLARAPMR